MSVSESTTPPQPKPAAGVSMHDLLAACAAASAVSTPPSAAETGRQPRTPRPEAPAPTPARPEAA
ncbi:hypothetical protein DN402_14220 [Streptomyces sp. SW4]|nr:hypothetical protein DN402_14220 [Streptomyces sp. SW4]